MCVARAAFSPISTVFVENKGFFDADLIEQSKAKSACSDRIGSVEGAATVSNRPPKATKPSGTRLKIVSPTLAANPLITKP